MANLSAGLCLRRSSGSNTFPLPRAAGGQVTTERSNRWKLFHPAKTAAEKLIATITLLTIDRASRVGAVATA